MSCHFAKPWAWSACALRHQLHGSRPCGRCRSARLLGVGSCRVLRLDGRKCCWGLGMPGSAAGARIDSTGTPAASKHLACWLTRPLPRMQLGEPVDAFITDVWWMGVVCHIATAGVQVHFTGAGGRRACGAACVPWVAAAATWASWRGWYMPAASRRSSPCFRLGRTLKRGTGAPHATPVMMCVHQHAQHAGHRPNVTP